MVTWRMLNCYVNYLKGTLLKYEEEKLLDSFGKVSWQLGPFKGDSFLGNLDRSKVEATILILFSTDNNPC